MNETAETRLRRFAERMKQLRRRDFLPQQLLDIVETVYARQLSAAAEARISLPAPGDLAPADMHAQGAPLVLRSAFPHDADQARALFGEFLGVLESAGDAAADAARLVAEAVKTGDLAPGAALTAFLEENERFFGDWERRIPDAPRTVLFLAQSSLAPSVAAAAEALAAAHHDLDAVWTHQHCPICGGLPLMADLKERQGFRYASCSFCRTRYRIPRLSCAFCGETDASRLSYFSAEDEPGYRVEVCATCKLYLKTTDFRELDKAVVPVLDDLESLPLDILAGNEGFKRPTLSGLGF